MTHTVKFGRLRAKGDPDRDIDTPGTLYRNNMMGSASPGACRKRTYTAKIRVTRGVSLAPGTN